MNEKEKEGTDRKGLYAEIAKGELGVFKKEGHSCRRGMLNKLVW